MKIAGERIVEVTLPLTAAKAAVLAMREMVKNSMSKGNDEDAAELLENICNIKQWIRWTEEDEDDE